MYGFSTTAYQRLLAKIDTSAGPSGCWPWQGALSSRGYGSFCVGGRKGSMVCAHRAAYELLTGKDVPDDMQVDHECENTRCCNPAHLRVVEPAQNNYYRHHGRTNVPLPADDDFDADPAEIFA